MPTPTYLIALSEYGDAEQFYVTDDAASFAWISNDVDQPPASFFATARALADEDADDFGLGSTLERLARIERDGADLTSGSYENDKAQLVASYAATPLDVDDIGELTQWLKDNDRQIAGEYHGLWY